MAGMLPPLGGGFWDGEGTGNNVPFGIKGHFFIYAEKNDRCNHQVKKFKDKFSFAGMSAPDTYKEFPEVIPGQTSGSAGGAGRYCCWR